MSNQRETLFTDLEELLGVLSVPPYNTNPKVIRGMEHWVDTIELPAIIIDEGETEITEPLDFGRNQSVIDLMIIGRLRGTWEEANQFVEDVRIVMDSASNLSRHQMALMSTRVMQDIESDRKEIEMHYTVTYWYDAGAA